MYNGYTIIRKSLEGIMDKADMDLLKKLVHTLNENRRPNWIDIHNLRVQKYGIILHIDCHLTVPWYLNVLEAHDEVEALQQLIKSQFGDAIEFFVHTDGTFPVSCPVSFNTDGTTMQTLVTKKYWTLEDILNDKRYGLAEIN